MYPSVAAALPKAIGPIEGIVRWPYNDANGAPTAAMGLKVDDGTGRVPAIMLGLPWHYVMPVGAPDVNDIIVAQPMASQAQIADGWQRVKARQDLNGIGGGNAKFAALTNLRLDDAGIAQSNADWVRNAESYLRAQFPRYDTMPADAQLAILNMAWGMGPAFVQAKHFYKFAAAMNALVPDYDTAAAESAYEPKSDRAIQQHNALSVELLANAKAAQHAGTPFDLLWWRPVSEGGSAQPEPGSGSGPGGGGVASIAPAGIVATVGGVIGKITIGLLVFGFGWLGVSAYRAHQRGEPWGAPVRRLAHRINTGEKRLEAKVDEVVKEGLST